MALNGTVFNIFDPPTVLNNSLFFFFFFNLVYKKTVKLYIEICEINCVVLCCIACVLIPPAVRSQETFPRFVLTAEQVLTIFAPSK